VTLVPLLLIALAQSAPLDELVARARAGTERYRDPQAARAAGYRPVGPDFPGMGRHWIHAGLILRDTPDPAEPPILEYAEIVGQQRLVGVAYAALVRGHHPPSWLGVPSDAWHFHGGTVEEESFLRRHAGLDESHGSQAGPRIAVLHAWIWLENPAGLLATDNWALPFARLGYPAIEAPRAASQALALAAGENGRGYVESLVRAVGRLTPQEAAAVAPVVARHQSAARALLAGGSPPLEELADCWIALGNDLRRLLGRDVL
jgi:hypothetical protein